MGGSGLLRKQRRIAVLDGAGRLSKALGPSPSVIRLAGTLMLFTSFACAAHVRPLEIATTTSVVNSGLLDYVMRDFPGAPPRVHATGSGRSIAMLDQRAVDLVITHAPEAEERALAAHPNWAYQKLAYNHFVILGPAADPAGVRNARDAVDAFRRIADHDATFVSRGDQSGTHERELALWNAAGVNPAAQQIFVSGGSMATALRQADGQLAYTLSDASTWWQLESRLKLTELRGGDAALVNTYAVIYDKDAPSAAAFAAWLTSGTGRQRIDSYRIANRQAFSVWPSRCPASTPRAAPCGSETGDTRHAR